MGILKSIKFRDKLYMTLKMSEPDTQEYAHGLPIYEHITEFLNTAFAQQKNPLRTTFSQIQEIYQTNLVHNKLYS